MAEKGMRKIIVSEGKYWEKVVFLKDGFNRI